MQWRAGMSALAYLTHAQCLLGVFGENFSFCKQKKPKCLALYIQSYICTYIRKIQLRGKKYPYFQNYQKYTNHDNLQKTESADSIQKIDSKKVAGTKDDKKAATSKSAPVTGKSATGKTATSTNTTTKASKIAEMKVNFLNKMKM